MTDQPHAHPHDEHPHEQHPHDGAQQDPHPAAPPTDERADPPPPGSAWVADVQPFTEAEREAVETVRSISRLEESN